MTAANLSGLTPDGILLIIVVGSAVLVAFCFLTIPALWAHGPDAYEEPRRFDPTNPGLFAVDELELLPFTVIHTTCQVRGCDERVCYCPVTDGLPCVGTVDVRHTHQTTQRSA